MGDEMPERYVVLKASGSRYAYVNDTHEGRTIKRFDIFKGDGWSHAKALAKRLNATTPDAGAREGGE